MSKTPKTNPHRVPKTQVDVDVAYLKGMKYGIKAAAAIFLLTLMDKEHADGEILQRVWREVEDVNQDILDGKVKLPDVLDALKKEYGINITE